MSGHVKRKNWAYLFGEADMEACPFQAGHVYLPVIPCRRDVSRFSCPYIEDFFAYDLYAATSSEISRLSHCPCKLKEEEE